MEYNFQIHADADKGKRFVWSLKGPKGGTHIWAQFNADGKRSTFTGEKCYGGVEVHYPQKPYEHSPDDAPIKDCWLTGCDCWPDGSSLYFCENIQPMVEMAEDNPESLTEWINSELLDWYRSHLDREATQ